MTTDIGMSLVPELTFDRVPSPDVVVVPGRRGAGVSAGIDWALHLVARLTDEPTARRVQLAIDYDPQPPFGGIDWERIPLAPGVMRRAIGLAAPVIAARPKRLTRAERKGATDPEPTIRR
jgi:hypothetical protein